MDHYIEMTPREVRFVNRNGEELDEDKGGIMDWKAFLEKVEDHPQWVTKYKLTRIMSEIWEAYHDAIKRGDWVMILNGDSHKELVKVCEEPKYSYIGQNGPGEILGWGISPQFNTQMVCFPSACINAPDKDPRPKVEEEPKEEKASADGKASGESKGKAAKKAA